jgi:hypothetical protein
MAENPPGCQEAGTPAAAPGLKSPVRHVDDYGGTERPRGAPVEAEEEKERRPGMVPGVGVPCIRGPLVLFALTLAAPRPTWAIPVFARIYDKPCGACHTVYPQLNPEGERFRAQGLHGFTPAVKPLTLGEHVSLPGTLPLALSLAAGEDVSKIDLPVRADPVNTHLNLNFLGLLAGGELGPHLSFLADYALLFGNPITGEISENRRVGLAFLQAHGERWGWLGNLRAGLFELPLGVSPRVHRLSVQSYLIYGLTAFDLLGQPPPVRGARRDSLVLGSTQLGLELSGLKPESGVSWAAGVTNGSNNREDNNSSKDLYLRLAKGFGFHGAGLFLYYSPDVLGVGARDQALRMGPDLNLYYRQFRLMAQLLSGWDSNPTGHGRDLWFLGGFIEGNYRWTPSLLSLLRIDHAFSPSFDDRKAGGQTHVRPRIFGLTAGGQYLLFENLKLIVEGTYNENHEGVTDRMIPSWLVTVRIATAFWPLTPPGISLLTGSGGTP